MHFSEHSINPDTELAPSYEDHNYPDSAIDQDGEEGEDDGEEELDDEEINIYNDNVIMKNYDDVNLQLQTFSENNVAENKYLKKRV